MRPWEEGRYIVNRINRVVTMKSVVEDGKRCNIATVKIRLQTVRREESIRRKTFCFVSMALFPKNNQTTFAPQLYSFYDVSFFVRNEVTVNVFTEDKI